MTRLGRYRAALLAGALSIVAVAGVAQAQQPGSISGQSADGAVRPGSNGLVMQMATENMVREGDAPKPEATDAQVAHVEHDESAPPGPINWFTGLIGEREGVEPSLLWRAPGTPAPFGATLINFGVFVFVVVRFGSKPLANALRTRKDTIMRDIDEAQRMREASEKRLAEYEQRIEKIEEDLDRIRREFREQGERERERILAEANERRDRMKKDAEFLLSQELKQMRLDLLNETVEKAVARAADLLGQKLTPSEQDRYLEAFLIQLPARTGSAKGSEAAAAKGGIS